MFGASGPALLELGGLNADRIRSGESYRIFWSMWMHSGWIHIIINLVSQFQYLFMYEPDWGFWRTFILFWISGITGTLNE